MSAPQSRQALVEMLSSARHSAGLSIRRAAAAAGVPASTAQGWFDGRHLPTPALLPQFGVLLETLALVDSDADREAWQQAVVRMRSSAVVEEPPWVGLRAYQPTEKSLFVGRERPLESLIAACSRSESGEGPRVVVLIGDSGSGKSSLIGAGLIGSACGVGGALSHLVPLKVRAAELPDLALGDEPTLLIVDQFEEAEMLDSRIQQVIFAVLAELPRHVVCVVALAAQSFSFALKDDRFAKNLAEPVLMGAVSDEEYRRIIEEPARLHGRDVSPALIHLAIRDMREYGEPTAGTILPLLSSVLRRSWRHATGETLRAADYLAAGGLWSSLDVEAETVLAKFPDDDLPLVRRLVLSLVSLEEGRSLRRRSVPVADLGSDTQSIVAQFVSARLMVRQDGVVSIAHDALLSRWRRLAVWVEEEEASLLIGRRIRLATELWTQGGRQAHGLRPVEADLWLEWSQAEEAPLLAEDERKFLEASLERAETDRTEHRRAIARLRRRQHAAILAAVVAVVMMIAALAATVRSNGYRDEAEAATRSAQARQIALIADEVRPLTPNVAGQLSVAALALDGSVQTRSAVLKSAGVPVPVRSLGPTGNTMIAMTPDGGTLVRADSAGELTIWRQGNLSGNGERVASGGGQLFALSLSEVGGRLLAFVGGQQTGAIWDLTEAPRKLGEFGTDTVAYSSGWRGGVAYFGTLEGQVRRIDCSDPTQPKLLPPLDVGEKIAVTGLAVGRDHLVAGGRKDRLEVFRPGGERLGSVPVTGVALSIGLSPDGADFLVGLSGSSAVLLAPATTGLAVSRTFETPASVFAVHHGGEHLFVAGSFGEVREYSPAGGVLATYAGRTAVTSIDMAGDKLLVGSTEGVTALWSRSQGRPLLAVDDAVRLYDVVSASDAVLVGTSAGPRMMAVEAGAWRELPLTEPPAGTAYGPYYAISGDGRTLVDLTDDNRLITFERSADGFDAVNELPLESTLADVRVSQTGRFLSLGFRGRAGYHLYERDGAGWRPLITVEAWPSGFAFSRDESSLVAMHVQGQSFVVWDLEGTPRKRAEVAMQEGAVPIAFAYAPDGTLAVGDNSGDVTIYDMSTPTPTLTQRIRDARSSISQLNFTAAGDRLMASTREGQLWVWKRAEASFVVDLQLAPGVAAIQGADSFNGWFVMSFDDGRSVAWPDDPARAVSDLCGRFGTRLSADEWARLVPGVDLINGC